MKDKFLSNKKEQVLIAIQSKEFRRKLITWKDGKYCRFPVLDLSKEMPYIDDNSSNSK